MFKYNFFFVVIISLLRVDYIINHTDSISNFEAEYGFYSYIMKITVYTRIIGHPNIIIYQNQIETPYKFEDFNLIIKYFDDKNCMELGKYHNSVVDFVPILTNGLCTDYSADYKAIILENQIKKTSSYLFYPFNGPRINLSYDKLLTIKSIAQNNEVPVYLNVKYVTHSGLKSQHLSKVFSVISFFLLISLLTTWILIYYFKRNHFHSNFFKICKNFIRQKLAICRLETHIATDKNIHETCSICLDNFVIGQPIRITNCKHIFHKKCIDPWLLNNGSCPLCKHAILEFKNQSTTELRMTV